MAAIRSVCVSMPTQYITNNCLVPGFLVDGMVNIGVPRYTVMVICHKSTDGRRDNDWLSTNCVFYFHKVNI